MLLNSKAKRVLCFGDSLVYGMDMSFERYSIEERWTGILQKLLGNDFDVIEEGLGGRTTDLNDGDKGRNGFVYFKDCLKSHDYLDYVIILLGINDLKEKFGRDAKDIVEALSKYIEYTNTNYLENNKTAPKVIILIPPLPQEAYIPKDWELKGSEEKAKFLVEEYKKLPCEVIDLNEYVSSSVVDGVHLDPSANIVVAEKLASVLLSNI